MSAPIRHAMQINRDKFFAGFRDRLDSTIEQEQVDGLEFILGQMESDPYWVHIPQIAYALATVFHETAGSFQPVEEGYYLGKTKAKAFQRKLRYYPYFGRGYVQTTWKKNYQRVDNAFGTDTVQHPEKALNPDIAYRTMTLGMHQGWFTGKKLDDYIKGDEKDYVNARRIINGTDKAGLIAGYARSFEKILINSTATATPTSANLARTESANSEPLQSPSNDTQASLVPVPLEVVPQPVIEVEAVTAEPESQIDKTLNKWSARFVAVPTAVLTFAGGLWSSLTSSPEGVTITLIVGGLVIAGVYFLAKMIINSRAQSRKDKLQAEREARAHEIQLAVLASASDPSKNTVRIVSPPVTEMPNSDPVQEATP